MHIQSIEVADFRCLQQPVKLQGLTPGLNLIVGDNEAGKSTLLEALQAVLFEKYNLTGDAAKRLLPSGKSARPRVSLEFSLHNKHYQLFKAFCNAPEVRIDGPDLSVIGPEADDYLTRLLGFSRPGRGATNSDHQGIWGLLWVKQGDTHELRINPGSHSLLRQALENEVGQVLGGAYGEKLLKQVEAERKQYRTDTGRIRGGQALEQDLSRLKQELEQHQQRLHRYQQQVQELQRVQDELARYQNGQLEQHAQQRVLSAEQAAQVLEQQRLAQQYAEQQLKIADHQLQIAQERRQRRRNDREQLQLAEQLWTQGNIRSQELQAELKRAEEEQYQARSRSRAADQALTQAQQQRERARQQQRRLELQRRRQQVSHALHASETTSQELIHTQQRVYQLTINEDAVRAVRKQQQALEQLQARQQAVATMVQLQLNIPVWVNGQPIERNRQYQVEGPVSFDLGQFGQLRIVPGGQELPQLQQQIRQLQAQLQHQLQKLHVTSVDAAEEQVTQLHQQRDLLQAQQRLLRAHAPDGIDALRGELQAIEAELTQLASPDDEALDAAEWQIRLEQAEQAARIARAQWSDYENAANTLRARIDELVSQQQRSLQELERQRTALAQARQTISDEDLNTALQQAQQLQQQAQSSVEQAQQQVLAAEPERVDLELANARAALQQLRQRWQELNEKCFRLEGSLRGGDYYGLGERCEQLAAEVASVERDLARRQREGDIWQLLYEQLQEAALKARQTFLKPVLECAMPYLQLWQPGAHLQLDEQFVVHGLQRHGLAEPFHNLSLGTREQLAVIIRLAFAELLSKNGHPVVVVLDDALVYSDALRLQRMQWVLTRAAQHFQILLLSCREQDWQPLGAPTWYLGAGSAES